MFQENVSDQYPRLTLRCVLEGHLFDFNSDLGAVAINRGAACTPCMDRMFDSQRALYPNGERPYAVSKARKKHEPFRHRQKS